MISKDFFVETADNVYPQRTVGNDYGQRMSETVLR